MHFDHTFAAAFTEGFNAAARLRELLNRGDASDPAIVAEIVQLSGLMRPIVAKALVLVHETLAGAGTAPRKALEAMGLTQEEVRKLADAFLAIYDDKPEAQA